MEATLLLLVRLMVGTGFGLGPDSWKHRRAGPNSSSRAFISLSQQERGPHVGHGGRGSQVDFSGRAATACPSTGRSATTRASVSRTVQYRRLTDVLRCKFGVPDARDIEQVAEAG